VWRSLGTIACAHDDLIAPGMAPADAAIQAGRRYAAMLFAEGLEETSPKGRQCREKDRWAY